MKMFVYEPDLLIRDDIVETLTAAFGVPVEPALSIGDALHNCEDALGVIVALSRTETENCLEAILDTAPLEKVVVIASDLPADKSARFAASLRKPFSGDALVDVVRTALFARQ